MCATNNTFYEFIVMLRNFNLIVMLSTALGHGVLLCPPSIHNMRSAIIVSAVLYTLWMHVYHIICTYNEGHQVDLKNGWRLSSKREVLKKAGLDEGVGLHTLGLLHGDLYAVGTDEACGFLSRDMTVCKGVCAFGKNDLRYMHASRSIFFFNVLHE